MSHSVSHVQNNILAYMARTHAFLHRYNGSLNVCLHLGQPTGAPTFDFSVKYTFMLDPHLSVILSAAKCPRASDVYWKAGYGPRTASCYAEYRIYTS